MNITKINKYNKKLNSTSTTKIKTNKYTRRLRYIIYTWRTLLKLAKYKKLNYELSKNKHTTDEDKNNEIQLQFKIHQEHLKNVNKIKKYKKLNMTEHKTDMIITRIEKKKKKWTQQDKKQTWTLLKMKNTKKYKK